MRIKKKQPKEKVQQKLLGSLSGIIADLRNYVDVHPDVVKKTSRMLDKGKGPEETSVDHIPIEDVIKILDEVITTGHGSTWSTDVQEMSLHSDSLIVIISLQITDTKGITTKRVGAGASYIYARSGKFITTDSLDNASKSAVASAIKKASYMFGLGHQMWKHNLEKPRIVETHAKHIPDGKGTIHTEANADLKKGELKERKLPDDLAKLVREKMKDYMLTDSDLVNIMKHRIADSGGDTRWLLGGITDQDNPKARVQTLLNEIEEEMKVVSK